MDRFWAKVRKSDGCWEWTASRKNRGHGQFKVGDRMMLSHRVSWELHNGPIPDGLCVCHHCDNPPCVRPDHLFLGTVRDNVMDMVEKGRHGDRGKGHRNGAHTHPERVLRGDAHGATKASDADVDHMRLLLALGVVSQKRLRAFGLRKSQISNIARGASRAALSV